VFFGFFVWCSMAGNGGRLGLSCLGAGILGFVRGGLFLFVIVCLHKIFIVVYYFGSF